MRKKYILVITMLLVTLSGCASTDATEETTTNNTNNITATVTAKDTEDSSSVNLSYLDKNEFKEHYESITLQDNPQYSSLFVQNGTTTVFANYDDNNNISVIQEPYDEGRVNTKNVIDYLSYSTSSFTVINNLVYFRDDNNKGILSSVDLTTKSYIPINTEFKVSSIIGNGSTVYFINDTNGYNLMSYDTIDKTFKLITSDKVGKYMIDTDVVIYINKSDNNTLYSINTDGTNKQKLTSFSIDSFAPNGNEIITINSSDDNNLYSINLLDLSEKRLAIMYGEDLRKINGVFYFINKRNGNHLESLTIDSTDESNPSISFSDISSESVNDYYVTEDAIFIQRSADVNNAYSIINK